MSVSPDTAIIALKVLTGAIFIYVFLRNGRRSALFLGIGWISSGNLPLGGMIVGDYHLDPLLMGLSTSITIIGIMELMREERGHGPPRSLLFSLPPIPFIYGLAETALGLNFGGTYVISGFLLIAGGGTFIEFLKEYYGERAVLFGITLILAGIASMIYPLVIWAWRASYTLMLYASIFLAILTIVSYYWLVFSEKFLYLRGVRLEEEPVDLGSGVRMVDPGKFNEIKRELDGFPVLAFLRSAEPGEGWIVYRLSTVEGKNTVHPNSLYRITQVTSEYLKETEKMGLKGVIVLDSPEVLRMYNGFESLLRFLSALGDVVKTSGGLLMIVTERGAWEEREWALLQRVV